VQNVFSALGIFLPAGPGQEKIFLLLKLLKQTFCDGDKIKKSFFFLLLIYTPFDFASFDFFTNKFFLW
jgi:hypothetical protein